MANTIRENYGWAGKEFIEYVKLISVEELRIRYKLIFDEIMQKCDTTDKQAYSMALILLADELSCSCIFPQDRPIQVEDISKYLHSNKTVDIAERAFNPAPGFGPSLVNPFCQIHDQIVKVVPAAANLLQLIGAKGQIVQKAGGAGHGILGHVHAAQRFLSLCAGCEIRWGSGF